MQLMGWAQLAQTVKSGRPAVPTDDPGPRRILRAPGQVHLATQLCGCDGRGREPQLCRSSANQAVLDVAAGAATWSIPFAQAIRAAKVTVVDLPEVTPVTRDYTSRFGVGERYEYLEGNLRELDLGSGYDLVTLGHIIHGEGPESGRKLIERSSAALGDGGMLLIGELVPNDEHTGPPAAMLFGLNMLLHSADGDVFTMKEYREWLKAAGFKQVKTIATPMAPSPLILAQK